MYPFPSPKPKLPLAGVRVVEFAGLAPGPFVGMVLADFGADVVRVDKVGAAFNPDSLSRGKRSVSVDPKKPSGLRTLRRLCSRADVIIDPFRPGVLERLGLGPDHVREGVEGVPANSRAVIARLTGFQRVGPYANMAGHDINYIALSGVLSMLGSQPGGPPVPPANLLGDFAGGSMVCLLGILLALFERERSGQGQVVESDMVSGARYVSTFLLLASYLQHPAMGNIVGDGTNGTRATGALDGGAPWYAVYATKDGLYMSVGAIEPPFYAELLRVLRENYNGDAAAATPHPSPKSQSDRSTWPRLRAYLAAAFATRTQAEWTASFVGTDACVAPVLTRDQAATQGFVPAAAEGDVEEGGVVVPTPAPRLSRTPARAPAGSVTAGGESSSAAAELLLTPGEHTEEVLASWLGVKRDELGALYEEAAVGGPDAPTTPRGGSKL